MEKTAVQKLAGALKVLVTITLVCNLVALLLVPGMSLMKAVSYTHLTLPTKRIV